VPQFLVWWLVDRHIFSIPQPLQRRRHILAVLVMRPGNQAARPIILSEGIFLSIH
jgi:hypothetical protein